MPAKREDITVEGVAKLASYGCTVKEIADFFDCSESNINHKFAEGLRLGRSNLHASLRRWQVKRAYKGSDTMLVHLGKHYLGQVDRQISEKTPEEKPAIDENGTELEP